jgi:hypothetical protein
MNRIVIGLFTGREAALRARQALRDLGVPADCIGLHDDPGSHRAGGATRDSIGSEPGLPALMDTLFLPAADHAAHREALRRGGMVVWARVDASVAPRAMQALDAAGAQDLEAAEQGWRREGWSPAAMAGSAGAGQEEARREPGTGRARSYVIEPRGPGRGG